MKISLKFVHKGPIDNKQIIGLDNGLVPTRLGDKPLSEPKLTGFTDAYMRYQQTRGDEF